MSDRDYRDKYKPDRSINPVYKEDSTKGKSLLINPQTFKGDALVQVWVDSRILATLSNWLDSYNRTRFMSEVVKDTLKAVVEMLVDQGEVEFINDTLEARSLLELKYRINLNPRNKGMKNVMHNQLLSNKNRDIRSKLNIKQEPSNILDSHNNYNISIDDVEMTKRMIEFRRRERATRSELKGGMSNEELKVYNEEREREIRERENAPVDPEEIMRLQKERMGKSV